MKLFHVMVFVLCDSQKDAQAIFINNKHLVFYKNIKDLKKLIKQYLEHDKDRQLIAGNGKKEVLEKTHL